MQLDIPPHISPRHRNTPAELNARFQDRTAQDVLAFALRRKIALVSSFGTESVVLLHLLAGLAPATPVLFLDTQMLFAETLSYQRDLAGQLGLRDVRTLHPDRVEVFRKDTDGLLHRSAPDQCCALRKTRPLEQALAPFDSWITGRKRYQGGARQDLAFFENDAAGRLKINPLAHWTAQDIATYMTRHDLPRHPLLARGYTSVGCLPCTSRAVPGEAPRAGRWRGQEKTECGIHFSPRQKGHAA